MTCQSCGKRLTRKTARTDGKRIVCGSCLFRPGYPDEGDKELKVGHST